MSEFTTSSYELCIHIRQLFPAGRAEGAHTFMVQIYNLIDAIQLKLEREVRVFLLEVDYYRVVSCSVMSA